MSQIYLAGTARISCMRRKCSMYRTHGASKRQLLQFEELLMSEWPDLSWSSWWHHPTVWKRAMVRSRCRNPFFFIYFFYCISICFSVKSSLYLKSYLVIISIIVEFFIPFMTEYQRDAWISGRHTSDVVYMIKKTNYI